MADHDLDRFLAAQDGGTYDTALREIRAGRKRTHWMWYVWPQIAGLGSSPMALRYAIASQAEARAFATHPILGPRLREISGAMLAHEGTRAATILGEIDAMKLRSCATLFEQVAPDPLVFEQLLAAFHDGERCERTLSFLRTG